VRTYTEEQHTKMRNKKNLECRLRVEFVRVECGVVGRVNGLMVKFFNLLARRFVDRLWHRVMEGSKRMGRKIPKTYSWGAEEGPATHPH